MTKSRIQEISIALLISMTGGILPSFADTPSSDIELATASPAVVRVSGDVIYYEGDFSEPSTKAFKAAISGIKRGQLTRLVISSGGGATGEGREIGSWVHDMSLIVEVEGICFSSCANYVFPAGSAKVIRKNAFVGWHGNERGFVNKAQHQGETIESLFRKSMPPELLKLSSEVADEKVSAAVDFFRKSIPEEAKFYAMLGLNDAFSMCAVGDAATAKYPNLNDKKGWGFTVDDMTRLGLKNITYQGYGAYETSPLFVKYLGLLSADDCLSLLK